MTDDWVTKEDWAVFAQYGKTMLHVQQFEQAVKQLAHLYEPELSEDVPFEVAWRRVEKQLRRALEPLTRQLEEQDRVPQELLEEIRAVIQPRNTLAHEFLLSYINRKNHGLKTHEEAIKTLQDIDLVYQSLDAEITELSHGLLRQQGIDTDDPPLTEEKLWQSLVEIDEAYEKQ
jgi:hypothetical protein